MTPQTPYLASTSASIARAFCLTAALVTSLLTAHSVSAEVYYKWQEANGNWTYGAHPPTNVEVFEVKTTSVNVRTPKAGEEDVSAKASTLSEADAKRHALYCETAKANLEALASDAVIHRRDEMGQIVPVSEDEKELEQENAEQAIAQYCHQAAQLTTDG